MYTAVGCHRSDRSATDLHDAAAVLLDYGHARARGRTVVLDDLHARLAV